MLFAQSHILYDFLFNCQDVHEWLYCGSLNAIVVADYFHLMQIVQFSYLNEDGEENDGDRSGKVHLLGGDIFVIQRGD